MKPQHFLLLLVAFALYWMYELYEPFLLSIIIAALMVISTFSIQQWLESKIRSHLLAALLSTFLLSLLFFAPLTYFFTTLALYVQNIDPDHLKQVVAKMEKIIETSPLFVNYIKPYAHEYIDKLSLANLASNSLAIAGKAGGYSAKFLQTALMILLFYFFILYYRHSLVSFLKKAIFLPEQETTMLGVEVGSVMSTVFYSVIVTAVLEGALFGIAVHFLGYNGILFGIMYGFASLIPIVGGLILWAPFSLYELAVGDTWNAIFIAVYTVIVIAIIADTFVKPLIIKFIQKKVVRKEAMMNELLIFFAILAGLGSFGFWGMVLGPAITAFFLSVLTLISKKREHDASAVMKS